MDQPVNFDSLRALTGGDIALETELFKVFITSSAECVTGLRSACTEKNGVTWRKHAHALKGNAFNLGADRLGALCKKAESGDQAATDDKIKMLASIEEELERVNTALRAENRLSA